MGQNRHNNITVVNKGMVLPNAIEISGNTLHILPVFSGRGNVSWFFELPNNKLAIFSFRWLIRPQSKVICVLKHIRTTTQTYPVETDLKYNWHYDIQNIEEGSWISLSGMLNDTIRVDIKSGFPYWTKPDDKTFNDLIKKYNLTLRL